jgi:phosphopantothenoylcysteine decarboxylase/phosphopantothenate--cysteine ligase
MFTLHLTKTPDILYQIGQVKAQTHRPHALVGFAAETNDLVENALSKLERKNADFIVANDITRPGAGFAADTNIVTILNRDGSRTTYERQTKTAVAEIIIDRIATILRIT